MYRLVRSKLVKKQMQYCRENKTLAKNLYNLLEVLEQNPFMSPPFYEKLAGELKGAYSRRINHQHRLVYTVDEEAKTVYIHSVWSHYNF